MIRPIASLALAGFLATAMNAGATLYHDINNYGFPGRTVDADHALVDWFDIADHGFNPDNEQVVWAAAEFVLMDADKNSESFVIDLGTGLNFDSGGIDDIFLKLGWFTVSFEFAGGVLGELITQLNDDGRVQYSIRATAGDFSVLSAGILARTETSTTTSTRVPDGGLTLALLGGALLGIGALYRKRQ